MCVVPIFVVSYCSQNILIGSDGGGKISDFGFAIELPRVCDDGRSLFTAQTFARSEGYFPSELTSGKYSAKSDVYSYGVVSGYSGWVVEQTQISNS